MKQQHGISSMTNPQFCEVMQSVSHLGSHCSFQIVSHFSTGYGGHLLARDIHQTTDLITTDGIKQDRRRICQDNMSVVGVWKGAVFQDQTNKR